MASSPLKTKVVGSYEIGKTLGKGSYSTVKRGYHIVTRNEVAIKIISPGTRCDMEDIEREIAILKLLKHPNIIDLLDVIYDEENKKVYLVFELVNGGDLFDYTIARGRLTEREARRVMREVVSAVAYCHANMVIHRDIKLENLLMDKDGHARIADFGMSGIMQAGLKMNTFCGSPMYMSPEIVQGLGYGPGVDIWSLGVVLYTIVVGCTPWRMSKTQNYMVENMDDMLGGIYSIPEHVKLSPECMELISLMIVPEHANRATIEQIMEHPWLREGYEHPITVPCNVTPVTQINEAVLKHMLAMGYSETHTRKAISDNSPSPARMVYQHIIHQLEEGYDPLVPASPRKQHRRHGSSPRSSASTSPRSASTSPRRNGLLLDGRARAISDASKRHFRKSLELPSPLSLSCGALSPISPRTALTTSWRQSHMSTIKEEIPVGVATENGGHHRHIPNLSLEMPSTPTPQSSSTPNTPMTSHIPILPLSPTSTSSPFFSGSPSAPTSPTSSPRNAWSDEPLVVVRGAFNVATTTLKPRRTLLAEIERVLTTNKISYSLARSVFACKVEPEGKHLREYSSDSSDDEKQQRETDAKEAEDFNEGKLKFEVEVCRVAGLEMLLGVKFYRVRGDKGEYQEICKKLMASMKL